MRSGSFPRGTTRAPRPFSAALPRSTRTAWPDCSWTIPRRPGGWPGGRPWITTRSAIGRANFAAALVDGAEVALGTSFDPIALAARHGQGRNLSFFARLLLGADGPKVPLDAPGRARHALVRLLA